MADFMGKMRKFTQRQVEKMDEAAKRFSGLPGYDQDTLDAFKELKAKSKTKEGLTATEERDLDRLARKMIRESASETTEGMAKERKPSKLTEKEKKEMQESLGLKKGGMVPVGRQQMKQAKQEVRAARQEMKQAGVPKVERKAAVKAMKQERGLPMEKVRKVAKIAKKAAAAPAPEMQTPMMMGGGYPVKQMNKGGMANCGASMKPNGGSRNK